MARGMLRRVDMSLAHFASKFVPAFVMASSVALLAGCGGKSIGDDLVTKPADPTDPAKPTDPVGPYPACPGSAPACDAGDRTVASEASCGPADYCYSRTEACSGIVVWCAHDKPPSCNAVPVCDKGDVTSPCPASTPVGVRLSCYSRTACGTTISCVHPESACTALPHCQAGDVEVTAIDTCSKPGISCYPVTECNFTIHCYTP
jgi:hypothetical protein